MTLLFEIAGLLTVTDDGHFVVATFFEDFAGNFGTGNHWGSDFDGVTVGGKEDVFKRDFRANALVALEGLNKNDVPVFDEVLLRASLDNREFGHNERSVQQSCISRKWC